MSNLEHALANMPDWQADKVRELRDCTNMDDEEFCRAVRDSSDKIDDAMMDAADGEVSCYHGDRFQWLIDNQSTFFQFEKDAMSSGAESVSDIIAFAWYQAARDEYQEAINEFASGLEDIGFDVDESVEEDELIAKMQDV